MDIYKKLEKNGIYITHNDIERICKKYNLAELSIFGSSIRDDFNEDSDVDLLISFINIWENHPFDLLYIEEEFKVLLNKNIDVVCKDGLKNPIRKKNILSNREILYAI
jgi:predicted nucleotidyltransferase